MLDFSAIQQAIDKPDNTNPSRQAKCHTGYPKFEDSRKGKASHAVEISAGTVTKHKMTKRRLREHAAKFFVSWVIELTDTISDYIDMPILFFVLKEPQCSSA